MEREVGLLSCSEPDSAAFRLLFDRFYRPLLGFFIKRGFSESEAEDFVQETLLNAYRGFKDFRKDSSDTTWIFSIAGNIWLNHLRSQRTQKRRAEAVSLDSLGYEEAERPSRADDEKDSALEKILEAERRERLQSAILELPEGRRHALNLRLVHGLKYREIASVLKVEINTVKSQIFQAKKQLGERLGSELMTTGKGDR